MLHANPYPKITAQSGKIGCLGVVALLLLTVALTIAGTVWAIQSSFFSQNFKPVELSAAEETTLEQKLNALGDPVSPSDQSSLESDTSTDSTPNGITLDALSLDRNTPATGEEELQRSADGEIQPELYVEDDSKRRIELTERELNALLAKNTDLAEQLVVDLTDNLASIKLLVDLDPDFPFIGGKTLKVSGGTELSYQNNQPVIVMKGVSVWGVPIPNAWLGGLKNIDLVEEFGGSEGFWKSFADGIEDIRVQDSKVLIQLAE